MEGRSASARWGHDGYLNREHSRIESEGKTSRRSQISFTSRMLIRIREHEEIKRKDSIGAVRPIEEGQAYQASTAARHHIDFLSIFRIRPLTRTKKKRSLSMKAIERTMNAPPRPNFKTNILPSEPGSGRRPRLRRPATSSASLSTSSITTWSTNIMRRTTKTCRPRATIKAAVQ
jgi:hypothetical protein